MSFLAGAGLFMSAMSASSAGKSASSGNKLSGRALAIQEEQFEIAKQDRDKWNRLYGPIEQNLADFYQDLTPDYFAAQGLEAYQKDFQQQQEQLQEFYNVNGIESGVQADLQTKSSLQAARDKSKIRADAPFKVQEMKSKFLSLGLADKSGTQVAANSLTNTLSGQANIAYQSADVGYQALGSSLNTVATELDRERNAPKPTADQGETYNFRNET